MEKSIAIEVKNFVLMTALSPIELVEWFHYWLNCSEVYNPLWAVSSWNSKQVAWLAYTEYQV